MSINYPTWVTDDTPLPEAYRVAAKKILYAFAAREYAGLLHNAGVKWRDGEALTPDEEAMLADAFPGQWPTPPTLEQFADYVHGLWEPRYGEISTTINAIRRHVDATKLGWIDWNGLT